VARVIVDDLRSTLVDGHCELSARVRPAREPERRLYFRFPAEFAPESDPDGSPFLVGSLVWCMRQGEDLVVDAPVSPRLLENMEDVVEVMWSLRPEQMRHISVTAPSGRPSAAIRSTACLFGGGVDAWHAIVSALYDDPQTPSLTHLVVSPGFFPTWWDQERRDQVLAARERAIPENLRLVVVETNIKSALRGAQAASTALALGFERTLIPSTAMRGEIVPAGIHPALDYRFSTERTEIVHYGDASRLQKVHRLARTPILDRLRVCQRDDQPTDGNCGTCEKCVRTMLELHIAGALESCTAFERPLTVRTVARLSTPLPVAYHQWVEILHALGETPFDRRLRAAVRLVLARAEMLRAIIALRGLSAEPELRRLGAALPTGVRALNFASKVAERGLGYLVAGRRKKQRRPRARGMALEPDGRGR
jgi:hypothetical protein